MATAAAAILLMASKHKHKTKIETSSTPVGPDTHIDRNSAIALSIILFLVLVAIAWYLRLHFAHKRQADLERQLQAGAGQFDSTMGRPTLVGNLIGPSSILFPCTILFIKHQPDDAAPRSRETYTISGGGTRSLDGAPRQVLHDDHLSWTLCQNLNSGVTEAIVDLLVHLVP
ncbi:hypothetical protein G6011_08351 [Alternaria panax]|uniref:Uncharacterized protein n=1 Tax=Alternaria panax TaxID=48097 RepID=A0AAD4FJU2_9PLEO|nr:hypothetical protein G6011_08351 [Alternaria panax]